MLFLLLFYKEMHVFVFLLWLSRFQIGECPEETTIVCVKVCDPPEVTAKVGSDVILPCKIHPARDISMNVMFWKLNDSKTALAMKKGKNYPTDPTFTNRTKPFPEEMKRGNCSLQLFNVTEQDQGIYTFSLLNMTECNITLKVETTIVCDPPGVTAKVGSDVTLPCKINSERNISMNAMFWKLNDSKTALAMKKGKNYATDPTFTNRTKPFPKEMERGTCSLLLFNVTEQDEGIYTVSLPNRISAKTLKCNITLKVEQPENKEEVHDKEESPKNGSNFGWTVGVVGGVFALIVALIAGVLF